MLKNNKAHHVNQNININQSQARIEMWKQLLNSRKAANVLLKSKLADILRNNFDQNLLDEVEDFQTRFITEDELIDSLRREVNELDGMQHNYIPGEGITEKFLLPKMKKISRDMAVSSTRFNKLKFAFDDFQHKINE